MASSSADHISEARLKRALRTVAIAIECHGDVYWPIFEVLKAELDSRKARRAVLAEFRVGLESEHTSQSQNGVRQIQP